MARTADPYRRFACFCKEQADNKQYAIEKFIAQETTLKAQIEEKETTKVSRSNGTPKCA